jgi:myosin-5
MLVANYHKVDLRLLCTQILEGSIKDKSKYQLGLTKIFFRAGVLGGFEQYRSTRLNALATLIQKNFQRFMAVKRYQNLRRTTIGIQSIWRAKLAKRLMEEMRRDAAAILIQRNARGYLERLRYKRTTLAIVAVQSREFFILCASTT